MWELLPVYGVKKPYMVFVVAKKCGNFYFFFSIKKFFYQKIFSGRPEYVFWHTKARPFRPYEEKKIWTQEGVEKGGRKLMWELRRSI